MKISKFGEIVMQESDLIDQIMQGHDVTGIADVTVDPEIDLERMIHFLEDPAQLVTWTFPEASDISVPEFDQKNQSTWFMPEAYRELDIAAHVLDLCHTPEQLQRAGQELILFQEKGLMDLLRYLKYLVDVMRDNRVIWGLGRGSSVASYVLYLLGVHRIDSMFYDLDPAEFLR